MESKMFSSKLQNFLALFILFSLPPTPAFAAKRSYVVYMGGHLHGRKMTEAALDKVSDSQYEFLGSFLGSPREAKDAIFYSYRRYINGFAAVLDEEQAARISKDPNVVSVFKNGRKKLHTTHSWNFLSLENNNGDVELNSLWKKARYGEDIIIGNLDGGVWPESESFSDQGYGPIPSRWNGICQNNTKNGFPCNKKLIGVRYFYKGFFSECGTKDHSNFSARDNSGHGTHTLSTAGGNFVPRASVFGVGNGTAKGGAPRARVAAYKVCWPSKGGCFDADVLKAFDQAIHDGVDVLSVSLGGSPTKYWNDSIAIGSFHAAKHGIVVVASAGNEGPDDGTVSNVSPWMITVAASTTDRELGSYVDLSNGVRLKGKDTYSKSLPEDRFYPLITGKQAKVANAYAADALRCKNETIDPQKVRGKILVCQEASYKFEKGQRAALAGAVGVILCDNKTSGRTDGGNIDDDIHVLAASHISYTDCLQVLAYINSTKDPQAMIKPMAELSTKPAPFIAAFSCRGPNIVTPEILKPDITAPGVHVIAAYSEANSPSENNVLDQRRTPFMLMTGTSMSSPHVAGIAGLLKAVHPDWSPAAIRSAIMTTARTRDNTGHPMLSQSTNASFAKATPFTYGAGHIRPTLAADPGLVYDLQVKDYKDFLCALGYNKTVMTLFSGSHVCPKSTNPLSILNMNYPSITVPKLSGSITVSRTVKNVGLASTYTGRVRPPPGFSATVEPIVLKFKRIGEKKTFYLTLKAKKTKRSGVSKGYAFGELLWSDGVHNVRSPITVAIDPTPPPKKEDENNDVC